MEFERALFRIHQKALLTEPLRRFRFHLERVLPAPFNKSNLFRSYLKLYEVPFSKPNNYRWPPMASNL